MGAMESVARALQYSGEFVLARPALLPRVVFASPVVPATFTSFSRPEVDDGGGDHDGAASDNGDRAHVSHREGTVPAFQGADDSLLPAGTAGNAGVRAMPKRARSPLPLPIGDAGRS